MSMNNIALTADQSKALQALVSGEARFEDHQDLVQVALKHLWNDQVTHQPLSWGFSPFFGRSLQLMDRLLARPIMDVSTACLPESDNVRSKCHSLEIKRELKDGQWVTTRHERLVENGKVSKDETTTEFEALPASEETSALPAPEEPESVGKSE